MSPLSAIGYAWIAWLATWMAAARWANPTVKTGSRRDQFPARILVPLGAVLLFWDWNDAPGVSAGIGWALFAIVVAGILFAWWARLHLGRLWSGFVTRKQGHRIVDTGPYAIVRHPIYTGLIVSVLATGAAEGRWLAVLGAVVAGISFVLRARVEERFLREELGHEVYDAYARRVPMLIPFAPPMR
jgi:protein-S-isoprenylcysteine O-methyltransferase Ste14